MTKPKSLTGTIHLPDARLNFHLSFDNNQKGKIELKGEEAKMIGHILNQALKLSPGLQELMVNFADYLKEAAEKAQEGDGDGQGHEK